MLNDVRKRKNRVFLKADIFLTVYTRYDQSGFDHFLGKGALTQLLDSCGFIGSQNGPLTVNRGTGPKYRRRKHGCPVGLDRFDDS